MENLSIQNDDLKIKETDEDDEIKYSIYRYLPNPYEGLTENQIRRKKLRYLYMDIRYILNSACLGPRKIFALFKVDSSFT